MPKDTAKSSDPMQSAIDFQRRRTAYLKEKLKDVLTPEQLEIWTKQHEAQMEMQQKLLQQFQAQQQPVKQD